MNLLVLSLGFFLAVALLFYVIFGGADFGAGIVEIFLPKKASAKNIVTKAMAPVWEANHVWLILAVVILFMGFPSVYLAVTLYLHLPVLFVLIGIVARGCAFTFRYYDVLAEHPAIYSRLFNFSSVWTAFFLGTIVGACTYGQIDPAATGYYDLYLRSWLNPFCASVGLFTICLFSFIASVFLCGEAKERSDKDIFLKLAKITNAAMILSGSVVFISAKVLGHSFGKEFFSKSLCLVSFLAATLLEGPFWKSLKNEKILETRIFGVAMISFVLFGWFGLQYPVLLQYADGMSVTFQEAAAPESVLKVLLGSLVCGVAIIFPALFYLMKIFKAQTFEEK